MLCCGLWRVRAPEPHTLFKKGPIMAKFRGTSCIILLFCGVLLPKAVLTDDDLATRMRTISKDLDRQLQEMMASQAVKFTFYNTTGLPYNATTTFNPRGMGQLYNVTNMFIDIVQSKQAYPEGMFQDFYNLGFFRQSFKLMDTPCNPFFPQK